MNDATAQRTNLAAWLRLMRWPNLLIIALTQLVAWWCLIAPLPGPRVLTAGNFLLLCLSTVLIAAGGYIINDYFDVRIDVINKPEKVILEKIIPRRLAIIVHSVMNILALALAAAVAIPASHPEWLLLQLVCTGLLWRYSTTWKRQFMIGNVVVALMTALTIITLVLYEPILYSATSVIPGWHISLSYGRPEILLAFALFAFFLTWMREIVKDMEDYKGDDAEGCVTMPIKWGLQRSTWFVIGLGVLTLALLFISAAALCRADAFICLSPVLILTLLILPLTAWLLHLLRARTTHHFHDCSTYLKIIMAAGIFSLLALHYLNYA